MPSTGSAAPAGRSSWREGYWVQLTALLLINFSQGLMLTAPFTLAVYMVRDFQERQLQQEAEASGAASAGQVSEQVVGRLTGLLAASFSIACFFVAILWGLLSNVFGRKTVIVIGSGSSAISMLWFGLAGSFGSAFAARFVGGLLNGVLGAWKTMVGEMNGGDILIQGKTFSYMSIAWGVGTTVGPLLGGGLAEPCKHHPTLHGCGPHGLLRARPFILPCLVCAMLMATATALCCALLIDTLPEALRQDQLRKLRRRWRRVRRAWRVARARLSGAPASASAPGGGGHGTSLDDSDDDDEDGRGEGVQRAGSLGKREGEEEGDRLLLPQPGRSDDATRVAEEAPGLRPGVAKEAVVLEMVAAQPPQPGGSGGKVGEKERVGAGRAVGRDGAGSSQDGSTDGINMSLSEPAPGQREQPQRSPGLAAGERQRLLEGGGAGVQRSSISASEQVATAAQLPQRGDNSPEGPLQRQSIREQQLQRDLLAATLFDGAADLASDSRRSSGTVAKGYIPAAAAGEDHQDDDDLELQRSKVFGTTASAQRPDNARSWSALPESSEGGSPSPSPHAAKREGQGRPGEPSDDEPWRLGASEDGRGGDLPGAASPSGAGGDGVGAGGSRVPRPSPLERSGSSAVLPAFHRTNSALTRSDSVRMRMAALMRSGSRVFFWGAAPAPFAPHARSGLPSNLSESSMLLPTQSSSTSLDQPPARCNAAAGAPKGGKAGAGGDVLHEEEGEGVALLPHHGNGNGKSDDACVVCCGGAEGGDKGPAVAAKRSSGRARDGGSGSDGEVPWHADINVRLSIASYGLTAMLFAGIDELLPIFASAPVDSGGLGLEPSELALPLAVFGIALILYSAVGYPYLQRKMGTMRLALWGLAFSVVTCLMLPLTHTALVNSGRALSAVVLYSSMIVKCFAACSAFTGSIIMVNAAPPRAALGEVNGVGQTVAALVRGAGPALAGIIWAMSVAIHGAGQQFVPFLIISVFAAASGIVCHNVHLPNLK